MMSYVDGFVLVVPRKKIKEYRKMAQEGKKAWMKHGALQYFECLGDDLHPKMITFTFPKMLKLKQSETAWFSFIIYKSKSHRNAVNAKVMKEMQEKYKDDMNTPMPFDMKRMAYGGFKALVEG